MTDDYYCWLIASKGNRPKSDPILRYDQLPSYSGFLRAFN